MPLTHDEREWIEKNLEKHLEALEGIRERIHKIELAQAVLNTRLGIYVGVAIAIGGIAEHLIFKIHA